jgi:HSP20 family protein
MSDSMNLEGREQFLAAASEAGPAPEERYVFTPPIDIYEDDEGLVLEADLPGVSIDTLELQIQDNKLTLFGRVKRTEPEGAVIRHQEYAVGDFLRSFILSDEVDYDRISAKMNNGVLRIVLPKASSVQPRRIEVSE